MHRIRLGEQARLRDNIKKLKALAKNMNVAIVMTQQPSPRGAHADPLPHPDQPLLVDYPTTLEMPMPQASDELRKKFPGGCEEALDVLAPLCDINKGHIRPKNKECFNKLEPRHYDAVDYLFEEWDYGWSPEPAA